jgi:uncharacterized membrane protein YhaH (DUF805 family)
MHGRPEGFFVSGIFAKGLCLVGVVLMFFGQGGWFTVGVVAVVIGVLFGAWSMVVVRRLRTADGMA